MKIVSIYRAMVAGTTSLILAAHLALADDDRIDQLPALVEQGVIRSLAELKEQHTELLQGRLLDIELEYEDGRYLYEFEILGSDGKVREVYIDASDGRVLDGDEED